MSGLLRIDEPQRQAGARTARGFALWQLGFRPFYLLASSFAALTIPLWALQYAGWLGTPYLPGPLWHAHEMVYGFTLAVIVGFLLTAGRNWTGQPTPTGWRLAALALLWLAGRVLVLTPFGWAAAVANVTFPLAAAAALAVPLVRARNRRNYFFVVLLALMGLSAAWVHLAMLGLWTLPGRPGIQLALDVVLFIIAVMTGRVLPMFTNNGVPGAHAARDPRLERLALGSVALLICADLAQLGSALVGAIATVAALAHLARWWLWQPWKTWRVPLVWILHAATLWIPVHLALRATGAAGWTTLSVATHALTAGAIGALIIGMMTRTARGHTARPLRADRVDVACYLLVLLGALARVLPPWLVPAWTVPSVLVSSMLWSAGFGLYALRYAPSLLRPRLDGKPG